MRKDKHTPITIENITYIPLILSSSSECTTCNLYVGLGCVVVGDDLGVGVCGGVNPVDVNVGIMGVDPGISGAIGIDIFLRGGN